MAGEHADLTVARGQHDFIDFDVDDLPFARDDGEVDLGRKCVGHPSSLRRFFLHLLGALEHLLDRALSRKACSGMSSCFPSTISLEASDRVGDLDVLPLDAGELLGDVERLREEALNLAGAVDDDACPLPTARRCREWR